MILDLSRYPPLDSITLCQSAKKINVSFQIALPRIVAPLRKKIDCMQMTNPSICLRLLMIYVLPQLIVYVLSVFTLRPNTAGDHLCIPRKQR